MYSHSTGKMVVLFLDYPSLTLSTQQTACTGNIHRVGVGSNWIAQITSLTLAQRLRTFNFTMHRCSSNVKLSVRGVDMFLIPTCTFYVPTCIICTELLQWLAGWVLKVNTYIFTPRSFGPLHKGIAMQKIQPITAPYQEHLKDADFCKNTVVTFTVDILEIYLNMHFRRIYSAILSRGTPV